MSFTILPSKLARRVAILSSDSSLARNSKSFKDVVPTAAIVLFVITAYQDGTFHRYRSVGNYYSWKRSITYTYVYCYIHDCYDTTCP